MRQSGATLLELLVVLAVFGILLAVGVPGFAAFAGNSQLSSATNEFVSSLHLARSEAIKRHSRVVLCTSATGNSCTQNAVWHEGWLVFHDANNNATLDETEAIIRVTQAFPADLTVEGNQWVSTYISYTADGATRKISGVLQIGTLTLCHASGMARQIVINSTGRARTRVLPACP